MTPHVIPRTDLNKTDLAQAVAAELALSHNEAMTVLDTVFDLIARTVAGGHTVAITNFGSWTPYTKPGRLGRNPQNGEPVQIPETPAVRWRTSPRLRDHVRAGTPATIRKHPKGTLSKGSRGGDA